MISWGRFAVFTQINVIILPSLALVDLCQVLWCVWVDALGINEPPHTLGVHRLSHHRTVVENQTYDVSVHRGVDERGVVRGSEETLLDGGYRARAAAEDSCKKKKKMAAGFENAELYVVLRYFLKSLTPTLLLGGRVYHLPAVKRLTEVRSPHPALHPNMKIPVERGTGSLSTYQQRWWHLVSVWNAWM